MRYNGYGTCNLDSWTLDLDFIPATASGSTYGLGIILESAIAEYELNITIKIDLFTCGLGVEDGNIKSIIKDYFGVNFLNIDAYYFTRGN